MNLKKIREDFPILKRKINGKQLVYLDNSATTQKPLQVINAMNDYYMKHNANVHRGVHTLSVESTQLYEQAHEKVAKFINADFEEVIFTKNTTESLNLLAHTLKSRLKKGDEIVLTEMEHHSNIVPWQLIAKEKDVKLKFIGLDKNGELNQKQFSKMITSKTKIVSVNHMSNVTGAINPVEKIGRIAHKKKSLFIVDGAQSVPHKKIDVKKLGCDFFVFSGHKIIGPTGIGVLFGKKKLLEEMQPFLSGGDMIKEVTLKKSIWNNVPWKFEAGTPPIAEAIGLGAAIDYIQSIGYENIVEHEKKLANYALKMFRSKNYVELIYPKNNISPIFSFNIKGIHAHDVSSLLDDSAIAVRGGHHCAMPFMKSLGINGSVRVSFYFYNTKEEVDALGKALDRAKKVFL
ncbi:MAG: cysteine desulfurase [archaeon]